MLISALNLVFTIAPIFAAVCGHGARFACLTAGPQIASRTATCTTPRGAADCTAIDAIKLSITVFAEIFFPKKSREIFLNSANPDSANPDCTTHHF
jgi:hypothetical protein